MAIFEPGTRFADYTIVRLLGGGEVAEVYQVVARGGVRRALKVLLEPLTKEGTASKIHARFAQEAEALRGIDSVHVVRFFAAGIERGRVWIEIELVEGRDLRRILDEEGALPVERAVRLVQHACEGIVVAHGREILHRDLEPGNILVTADDVAKVADFGWVKLGYGVQTTTDHDGKSARYKAPEYVRSGEAVRGSDVYSMGLVLYEALTGAHPTVPRLVSMMATTERQLFYDPPALSTLGRGFPDDLSDLVRRALSKDPARRGTMRDLSDGLALVLRRLQEARLEAAGGPLLRSFLPDLGPALAKTERAMSSFEEPPRSAVLPPEPPPAVKRPGPGPVPSTLRSAWKPTVRTMPMDAMDRRTTAVPTTVSGARERPPALAGRRALLPVIGVALTTVLLAAGFTLAGRLVMGGLEVAGGEGSAAPAPATPGPPAATASASAPPAKPVAPSRRGPARTRHDGGP